jgi:hypothetical protein
VSETGDAAMSMPYLFDRAAMCAAFMFVIAVVIGAF